MAQSAFLAQVAASGAAVAILVGLAAWAKLARPHQPLDEKRARALLALEFPGRSLEGVWVSADGKGAVAKSGAAALVLCAVGEEFVGRVMPWAQALACAVRRGRICLDLGDIDAPVAVITLTDCVPEGLTRPAAA